ncbi:MAG: tRNA (5-methylaminomethyl-2-thiouridine)(34)-methyltransferase MnmD [Bacteroidales bacterium]|nr:tRNA (5-methylaminomethyl-2-thiouridine)(34)-methyltransferase MnmD [Bacteroidales bacterium]
MSLTKEIVKCRDGSYTLRSALFGECYHSANGALAESLHIFIRNGLDYYLEQSNRTGSETLRIFEAGFGTGLNTLLTALRVNGRDDLSIEYSAVELYPVAPSESASLNYPLSISRDYPFVFDGGIESAEELEKKINNARWDTGTMITEKFRLIKIHADILSLDLPLNRYDIVYYDMFSPAVHPRVWEKDILTKIYSSCRPGAVFITYSSKGSVKRELRDCGFNLYRLSGPEGKRHILRAVKPL